jgi:hypothetical protein
MIHLGSFEGAFLLRAMREAGVTQLFASGDGCWDVAYFLQKQLKIRSKRRENKTQGQEPHRPIPCM